MTRLLTIGESNSSVASNGIFFIILKERLKTETFELKKTFQFHHKMEKTFLVKLIPANLAKEPLPIKCPPTKCVTLAPNYKSAKAKFFN